VSCAIFTQHLAFPGLFASPGQGVRFRQQHKWRARSGDQHVARDACHRTCTPNARSPSSSTLPLIVPFLWSSKVDALNDEEIVDVSSDMHTLAFPLLHLSRLLAVVTKLQLTGMRLVFDCVWLGVSQAFLDACRQDLLLWFG